MINTLLFPFRLCSWVCVQLYRACGLAIVQPLRLFFWVFGLLGRRWMLALVVVVYGGFALRVYTPYPVGEWYTTIVHYPDNVIVPVSTLIADSLLYRETDAPDLRATQFRIVMYFLLAHALIVLTYNRHNRVRLSLASKAERLRNLRPPVLWPASTRSPVIAELESSFEPMAPMEPAQENPVVSAPSVFAHYGLLSRTPNEDLETIAQRLPPELRGFIGLAD